MILIIENEQFFTMHETTESWQMEIASLYFHEFGEMMEIASFYFHEFGEMNEHGDMEIEFWYGYY